MALTERIGPGPTGLLISGNLPGTLMEYAQGVIGSMEIWGRDVGTCWHACDHPERPPDPYVMWHCDPCRGCRVAAAALLMRYPDDPHVQWLNRRLTQT
jgi:hypothetical protein